MELRTVQYSQEKQGRIRLEFSELESEVTRFLEIPKLASIAASLGIQREVGTVNDEIARFVYDADTASPVPLDSMRAELVEMNGLTGVRVYSEGHPRLDLRLRNLRHLLHPRFSFNEDGTVRQLVIFPQIIAEIASREGVDLVVVKSWGWNSIFGAFDPSKGYYQTNFWELENNDALKFSALARQAKVAFLGTHDLMAHVAGIRRDNWLRIRDLGARVNDAISRYFRSVPQPSIAALVLPYTIGVVLDDLAQPSSYDSPSHLAVLGELLIALEERRIQPNFKTILREFPSSFESVITLSRTKGAENRRDEIHSVIARMIDEVLGSSLELAV